ncbi:MAG: tRNA pseudouridine(55) synthase TruB [Gammaproteobacteria bacterium]
MNGFILVNKQKDVSSNFVVQEIKKKIKAKKVGHTGTLDPLASGLLVLAIDRATKFSSYFLESNKSYNVEVSLGISTDTDDSTGNIISKSNDCPNEASVMKELYRFKGESLQVPPFFSALKHKGKPLYYYARKGEFISKPARKIKVTDIDNFKYKNKICSFRIQCSKGTYIRSIARDLGEKLGCGAHMKSLTRISQGKFCISKSKEISHISKDDIISIESAFEDLDSITIIPKDEKKFINGVTISGLKKRDNIYRVYNKDNTFIGIGEIKDSFLNHKQLV